jgi:hypothetical protein
MFCILFGHLLPLFLTSILLTSLYLHTLSPVGFGLAKCLYTKDATVFLGSLTDKIQPFTPHPLIAASLLLLSSSHVTVSPSIE